MLLKTRFTSSYRDWHVIWFLLAGSVIIETIFTWPGIGALLMKAISARDLVVIESTIMVIVFMFLIVNFVIDILYHVIDPRITYE